jgi:hypothetical protein
LVRILKVGVLKSKKQPISISNIEKKFSVLEVISSLGCELAYKSGIGRKEKTYDPEIVSMSLITEFMSIENKILFRIKICKNEFETMP